MSEPTRIDLIGAMKAAGVKTLGAGGLYVPLDGHYGQGPHLISVELVGTVRSISCWVTEAAEGSVGESIAGGAIFRTTSVQLYDRGTKGAHRVLTQLGESPPCRASVLLPVHVTGAQAELPGACEAAITCGGNGAEMGSGLISLPRNGSATAHGTIRGAFAGTNEASMPENGSLAT